MKLRLLILFLSISYLLPAQFNKSGLDSLFNHLERSDKALGSISITQDGELVYSNTIGYEDYREFIYPDSNTLYRIGSITKTYTSTIILQLVEEGKLQLETKLSEFYPKLPKAKKISIEDMLRHKSGLQNLTAVPGYLSWMEQEFSKEDILNKIHNLKSDFRPGSKTEYSNTNYILLGFIAETLDKKSYAEIVEKRICQICELKATRLGEEPGLKEAKSYMMYEEWTEEKITHMSIPRAAGAIIATSSDVSKFYHCLFSGKLVSTASLKQMMTLKDHMGLGLFMIPFNEKQGFGHTGGIDGFRSMAIYFPMEKMSIAYLSNGVEYPLNDIIIGALSLYFGTDYEFPNLSDEVYDSEETNYEMIIGVYSSKQLSLKIEVFETDGNLYAQASGQLEFPLTPIGPYTYKYEKAGIKLEFYPKEKKMILHQAGGKFTYYLK